MQLWMGRTLRANDNLMQMCVHGGKIKYGDGKGKSKDEDDAEAETEPIEGARNPMAAAARNPIAGGNGGD